MRRKYISIKKNIQNSYFIYRIKFDWQTNNVFTLSGRHAIHQSNRWWDWFAKWGGRRKKNTQRSITLANYHHQKAKVPGRHFRACQMFSLTTGQYINNVWINSEGIKRKTPSAEKNIIGHAELFTAGRSEQLKVYGRIESSWFVIIISQEHQNNQVVCCCCCCWGRVRFLKKRKSLITKEQSGEYNQRRPWLLGSRAPFTTRPVFIFASYSRPITQEAARLTQ